MVSFATVWEWFEEKNSNFAMASQSRKFYRSLMVGDTCPTLERYVFVHIIHLSLSNLVANVYES